jgi:phage shock protein E
MDKRSSNYEKRNQLNKRYIKMLSGLGVGAILGYLYYYYIGCASGTCAITSNPYISTAYGAMMGLVFMWPAKEKEAKSDDEENPQAV